MQLMSSYLDLEKFFNAVDAANQDKSLEPLEPLAKAALGCVLLTGSLDQMVQFSTNRYFINSIGLDVIPNTEQLDLEALTQSLIRHFKITFTSSSKSPRRDLAEVATVIYEKICKIDKSISPSIEFMTKEMIDKFDRDGYVIIPNFFDPELAVFFRNTALDIAQRERQNNTSFQYGYGNLAQRIYNLINKTDAFDELLSDRRLHDILSKIFKRRTFHQLYNISSWHANILSPGAAAQKLHADAAVPEPLPSWIIRANVNFLPEDYTTENGATLILPGSHKLLKHPKPEDYENIKNQLVPLEAKSGSIVIWNGHVWHQSGQNNSRSPRVALLACYSATFMLEMALEEQHSIVIENARKTAINEHLKTLFTLKHGIK